jgi:hypothetical protein
VVGKLDVATATSWSRAYRNSGVMTFIVNQDGVVYQKGLGQQTTELASAKTEYNPDNTWEPADWSGAFRIASIPRDNTKDSFRFLLNQIAYLFARSRLPMKQERGSSRIRLTLGIMAPRLATSR